MTTLDTGRTSISTGPTMSDVDDVASALVRLRSSVHGDVLVPGDAGYDEATLAWNRTNIHRPAVVVIAETPADVAAAVGFASANDLGLGIQATGHGAVVPVDGVLLVTSRLTELTVDPVTCTARVGAGCTWGPVLEATQRHGLAPLLGSSITVGAVGYTLGGGVGWLARKFGPACDSVRALEVVTPDGRQVRASADERTELFRALRGGGGGAAVVVTAMEIDLVKIDRVYAGNLVFPAEAAADVTTAYREWVSDAPDELTSSIVYMNFPPIPDVPEPLRGQSFTIVRGCWAGRIDEGKAFVDRLRARVAPLIDMWDEMPFAEMASISNDPVEPMPCVTTGAWLTDLDADAGATVAAATFPAGGPPLVTFSEIRHLGGVISRGDRSLSAMGNRSGAFTLHCVGVPMAPAQDAAIIEHLDAMKTALGDSVSDRVYLNFVDGLERRRRSADGIDPEHRSRVADVHRWFDPDGLLRYGVATPA
jgi:hypothetical protein